MQAVSSRDTAAEDYELHRRSVLGMLAKRFPRFDENERLEIYHEAWARVFAKRGRGEEIHSLRAYLLQTAAAEAMNTVTRRRPPIPVGPDDPAVTGIPDEGFSVEERVLMRDQVRLAREVIESLDRRQRDLVKLRWGLQLSASEIRAALGLSERQYQRLAEEGAAAIASRVRDLEDGTWSRRQRSLLTACLIDVGDVERERPGIASDEQRAEAQRLLESDPHVAALYFEVRGAMRRAAAILPLPAIPVGDGLWHSLVVDRISAASEHASTLATNAKQHAAGAYLRAADPALFAGVSPSAVAATVAASVAIGGGAYVAAEGLPAKPDRQPPSAAAAKPRLSSAAGSRGAPRTSKRQRRPRKPSRERPVKERPGMSAPKAPVDEPQSLPPNGATPIPSAAPVAQPQPTVEPSEFDFEGRPQQ